MIWWLIVAAALAWLSGVLAGYAVGVRGAAATELEGRLLARTVARLAELAEEGRPGVEVAGYGRSVLRAHGYPESVARAAEPAEPGWPGGDE